MRLRKADCGHWIPMHMAPAGDTLVGDDERSVYLCHECAAKLPAPLALETKDAPAARRKLQRELD